MPIHPVGVLTRADLTEALEAADAPDLIDRTRSRPLSVLDGADLGQTCLALQFDTIKDLAVFLVAVATWLGPVDGAIFADRTEVDMGRGIAYWPGIVLDETPELAAVS